MNRLLLIFCLGTLPLFSFAQNKIQFPVFKQEGKNINDFMPQNWSVIIADSGDFNDDHNEDYTLILEADKDYLNNNHFDTKLNGAPRILVILFGRLGSDSLDLSMRADSLILRSNGGDGDPLAQGTGIKTDGNIFEINYAGGTSVQWTSQYRFMYKNKDWTLATYKGTEYNTSEEDSPIKTYEIDFIKKFVKQDKVKTPNPSLPKLGLQKFKPKTIEIMPGLVI